MCFEWGIWFWEGWSLLLGWRKMLFVRETIPFGWEKLLFRGEKLPVDWGKMAFGWGIGFLVGVEVVL